MRLIFYLFYLSKRGVYLGQFRHQCIDLWDMKCVNKSDDSCLEK